MSQFLKHSPDDSCSVAVRHESFVMIYSNACACGKNDLVSCDLGYAQNLNDTIAGKETKIAVGKRFCMYAMQVA